MQNTQNPCESRESGNLRGKVLNTHICLKSKNRGITLVALIITIVIMLILVGVSVQIVVNSDIIGMAQRIAERTEYEYQNENGVKITIGGVEASIEDIVNGALEHTAEVNAPELIKGMIPVEWDGTKWIKADASKNNWYEYGTTKTKKRWANAVTVKVKGTKTREYYQSAEAIGKEVDQSDILGMYVWIPRYSYKIIRGYHTSNAGNGIDRDYQSGFVDIQFIKGTGNGANAVAYNSETTKNANGESYTKFPEGYVVHPAFKLGDTELTGIWVAKFEASSSTTEDETSNLGGNYGSTGNPRIGGNEVTIRPNVTSWRVIDVSNCYKACINMTKAGNIQDLSTGADSHLMKDTEWGAVAYLTQSAYGNAQISSSTGVWNNCYYEGDATGSLANKDLFGSDATSGYRQYATTKTGMVGIRVENKGTKIANPMSNAGYYRDNYSNYYSVKTNKKVNVDGSITISYQNYVYPSSHKIVEGQEWNKETGEWIWGGNTNTYTNTYYTYETENGVKGSTTGTIYGIYDMAGGSWEYQASYLNGVSKTHTNYFNDNVPAKHKITYAGTRETGSMTENGVTADGRYFNYLDNKEKYGNALWETSNGAAGGGQNSWNGDYSNFVCATAPFMLRGGYFDYSSGAGLFCFGSLTGGTSTYYGFRPVLSAPLT